MKFHFLLLACVCSSTAIIVLGLDCSQTKFTKLAFHGGKIYKANGECVCIQNGYCQRLNGTTNDDIKVLLPVPNINRLIICGTEANGTCNTVVLDDLSDLQTFPTLKNAITSVVGDVNGKRTIAFTGSGIKDGAVQEVLYTASHMRKGEINFPVLSVRNIQGRKAFQLFKQGHVGSRIELSENETVRKNYLDKFSPVAGFSHGGYAYFFANQMDTMDKVLPKLIRLCHNDTGTDKLLSYMDIRFDAMAELVDVILLPVPESYPNTTFQHVILAAFKNPTSSAVFVFTFEDINYVLRFARPRNDSYLARINGTCNQTTRNGQFCDMAPACRNFVAEHTYGISEFNPLARGSNDIAKLAGTMINNNTHTIVLVAWMSGKIVLYHLADKSYIKTLQVDPTGVQDLVLVGDEVYILRSDGITQYPLYNNTDCQSYIDGTMCMNQTNPFCGWCLQDRRCTVSKACPRPEKWFPIGTNFTEVGVFNISDFRPKKGPVAGGTRLVVAGKYLDNERTENVLVYIGDNLCNKLKIWNTTTITCYTPATSDAPRPVNVSVRILANETSDQTSDNSTIMGVYSYMEDPTISGIFPNRSFASGGRTLTVSGSNFDVIQNPRLQIVGENITEACDHTKNTSVIECTAPEATPELKEKLENMDREARSSAVDIKTQAGCLDRNVLCVDVEFKMDGVNTSLLRQTLEFVRDPVFFNFSDENRIRNYHPEDARTIVLEGDRINISATAIDFHVSVGIERCHVLASKVFLRELHCLPPRQEPQKAFNFSEYPEVQVRIGYIQRHVGYLRYIPATPEHYLYLYVAVSVLVVFVITLVTVALLLRRRNRYAVRKLQSDMDEMEMRIQTEFRQAFADLQTDMTDITGELVETGLPYNRFQLYAFQILFPADDVTQITSHKLNKYPETTIDLPTLDRAMIELEHLLLNKFFVLSVIRTLEQQRKLALSEKSSLAAFLAAVFLQDMSYFSQLTRVLLEQHIGDVVARKKHRGLFRRYESVTEKLTATWLGICLHQHILKSHGGSSLIMMVKALQTVMEKSPIDAITGSARSTLSCDQLLSTQVEKDKPINLHVQINGGEFKAVCPVLECDTISQVKAKCLGVIYKKDPASARPKSADVDLGSISAGVVMYLGMVSLHFSQLPETRTRCEVRITFFNAGIAGEWQCGTDGRIVLKEEDTLPGDDDSHVKLMTLSDYHVKDGSIMELLNRRLLEGEDDGYVNQQMIQNQLSWSKIQLLPEEEEEPKKVSNHVTKKKEIKYHLVKEQRDTSCRAKVVPEAHLHRLLQTKMNIKKFVDNLVDSTLDKRDMPAPVKYLFSVLERMAVHHEVDQDVLLSWKNNSYPVRFWGLLIAKPKILFDIEPPDYIQPSLEIIANTYIDSFSPAQTLSKNSSPHKLLFYKDLEDYRSTVKTFHRAVTSSPTVDDADIARELATYNEAQTFLFSKTSALFEIFQVLASFKEEILTDLENNKETSRLNLAQKLERVYQLMNS